MGIEAIGFGEGAPSPMRAWATLLMQIENELLGALGTSGSGPAQVNELNQLNQTAGPAGTGPPSQPVDSAPPPSGSLTQIARQLPLLIQTAQVGAAMELATSSLRSAVDVLTEILATLDELPASPSPQDLLRAQQVVRAAIASLPPLPVVVDEVTQTPPNVPIELPPSIRQLLRDLLVESRAALIPLPTPPTASGIGRTPPSDLSPEEWAHPSLPPTANPSPTVDRPGAGLQTLAQSLSKLQIVDSLPSGPFVEDRVLTSATLDAVRAALDDTGTWQREVTDGFRALGLNNDAASLDAVQAAVAQIQRDPGALVQGMLTTRIDISAATVLMLLQGALGPTAPRPFEMRPDDEAIERERCDDCVYWALCRFGCWRQRQDPENLT